MSSDEPFQAQYWNYMQVLAWVYLGDRTLVTQASDHATDDDFFWRPVPSLRGGMKIVKPNLPITLTHILSESVWKEGACHETFEQAEAVILYALQEGTLRALGLQNAVGDLQDIPQTRWADLTFRYTNDYRLDYAGPRDHRRTATRWYGLKFKRSEVLALWPDPFLNEETAVRGLPMPGLVFSNANITGQSGQTPVRPAAGNDSEATKADERASRYQVIHDRKENELHTVILRARDSLWHQLKRKPPANAVWKVVTKPEIDKNHIISERTNEEIIWRPWRGRERRLLRTSFNSLLSRLPLPKDPV